MQAGVTSERVVHVLPTTDDAGAENQARYLLEELLKRGGETARVELVYFRAGRAHASFEGLGLPLVEIPTKRRLLFDWRRRAADLAAYYAADPPAILHTWLYEATVVGVVAARAWEGTRIVMAHRSGNALRPDALRMRVLRTMRKHIDHTLVNSQEGLTLLHELGYMPEHVSLVPHALPSARVASVRPRAVVRSELHLAADSPIVCTVGRADQTKDLPGLLHAMRLVWEARPEAQLLFIGPSHADLSRLGLDLPARAHAVGWQADPASVMAACDVVVIPSWTEGHSNAADEALMLGLPVATTNTGAHAALVAQAGGRVVAIRAPAALAGAILSLLHSPPEPASVRSVATAALCPEAVLQATTAVYAQLLA